MTIVSSTLYLYTNCDFVAPWATFVEVDFEVHRHQRTKNQRPVFLHLPRVKSPKTKKKKTKEETTTTHLHNELTISNVPY